jgi:hypothetical protein
VRQSIDLRKEKERERKKKVAAGGWKLLRWNTRHNDEDKKN